MQEIKRKNQSHCCSRCLFGLLAYIFALLLLLFIVIFIIIPVVFKYSTEIQRNLIFPTWLTHDANFSNVESFNLKGINNFRVTVEPNENISLGCWQIIPEQLLDNTIPDNQYNYDAILNNRNYDILLYFHGNGGIRSLPIKLYRILRIYFNIIACDYRGYADSTNGLLTESAIVGDTIHLYNWVRNQSQAKIFFWGHSLGTAISIQTISALKQLNTSNVTGLVLETPFTSTVDVMQEHPIVKLYSWLPWFKTTLLDPMEANGFGLRSQDYIGNIDCPIMILHAKDDSIVPYKFASKLYEIAISTRNTTTQGNITYHLFEAKGYDHNQIYAAPELPSFIEKFIQVCLDYEQFLAAPKKL